MNSRLTPDIPDNFVTHRDIDEEHELGAASFNRMLKKSFHRLFQPRKRITAVPIWFSTMSGTTRFNQNESVLTGKLFTPLWLFFWLALIYMLAPGMAVAANAPGSYPGYPYPGVMPAKQATITPGYPTRQYTYPPPRPNTPYGAYPNPYTYGYPPRNVNPQQPFQAPARVPSKIAPSVETSISERHPVVQQNLIYRVRINGEGNLKEAVPHPPKSEAVIFRQLGKPTNQFVAGSENRKLVTEYSYILIPLKAGELFLPPVEITGTYNDGTPFNISANFGHSLYVQPINNEVQPWLPLYDLRISSQLPLNTGLRTGEPLEVEITTSAVGAVGTQLPSIATQLESEDFYVYPGKSKTTGSISSDGLDLIGSKIETFTLVPRWSGKLNLPSLSLQWWNLRSRSAATATLPIRQIQVTAIPGSEQKPQDKVYELPAAGSWFFWIPLLIVAALLLTSWLKALFGSGNHPLSYWISHQLRQLLGDLYQPVAAFGRRISPRRHFHRLRTWIGRQLPVSWKLWYCLHAVDKENDPNTWGSALQILAAKHLGLRPHSDLQTLGQSIVACHPAANPQQVAQLMAELDNAVYGGKSIPSFSAWKSNFKRQIKPRLFPIRLRHCRPATDRHLLPRLNPKV